MCSMLTSTTEVQGMGKGADGWFPLTHATIGYDHTAHSAQEHALLIDFTNYSLGFGARVALELDLASGRALLAQLTDAIEQAERGGA